MADESKGSPFCKGGADVRNRIILIYLLFVALLGGFVGHSLAIIYKEFNGSDHIFVIREIDFEDRLQEFSERTISATERNHYYYRTEFEGESLLSLAKEGSNLALVVTRLRGNWHQIYLNNTLIGEIGNQNNLSQNVWNQSYIFYIDRSLILDHNILSFRTYSDYKIGLGDLPLFFGESNYAYQLYSRIRLIHSWFYLVVISSLVAVAMIQIIVFLLTRNHKFSYSLFPLAVLAICVYMLDYLSISYRPLDTLLFKKICLISLHASIGVLSISLSKRYQKKYIWVLGLLGYCISTFFIASSQDMISLGRVYTYLNLIPLANLILWIIIATFQFLRFKNKGDFLLLLASLLLLFPSAYDVIRLIEGESGQKRVAVYGIVFFSVAILVNGMLEFVMQQNDMYYKNQKLQDEKERLSRALVKDDLTGLSNHRHFFECFNACIEEKKEKIAVLFIDIDKFRAINNTFGHTAGDQVLKTMAGVLNKYVHRDCEAFRFGGEEFVILLCDDEVSRAVEIAEEIRVKVVRSLYVADLEVRYPVTVSIGISMYPEQTAEPRQLVVRAEKANEYAKLTGRNRVCVYEKMIDAKLEEYMKHGAKKDLLIEFVITLASAIDLKDIYTGKHSEEVAHYSLMIADAMGLDEEQRYVLKMGSTLHDLGKIAIPDMILRKSDKLSKDEFEHIKKHTIIGSELIREIIDDDGVLSCVRHHHERIDGKGYPDGLKGDQISLLARIVCVADAYHAMVSDRPYRPGMSVEEAIEQLLIHSGTQFDEDIVQVFVKLLEESLIEI